MFPKINDIPVTFFWSGFWYTRSASTWSKLQIVLYRLVDPHLSAYPLSQLKTWRKYMLNFSNTAFVCRIYLFQSGKKPQPAQSFRGVLLKSPNSETGWAGNYVCTSWVWLQTQCCDLNFTEKQITHTCLCCTLLPIWDYAKCLKQPWLPGTCQNGNVETKELVERVPLPANMNPFILFMSLAHGQTSWKQFVSCRCNFCTVFSFAFQVAVWPDMVLHWEMCLCLGSLGFQRCANLLTDFEVWSSDSKRFWMVAVATVIPI